MQNYFAPLNQVNVSEHIERKGAFAYLSWPFAVAQLRLADPHATWEVRRFEGLPYLRSDCGHFVEVAVTVQGVCLSQIHPVLDAKNRSDRRAHELRHQHLDPARSGEGDCPARSRPFPLRREDLPQGAAPGRGCAPPR